MKPCSHSTTLPRHPAIPFKDKSERSALLVPCTHFVEFCYSLGFGTTAVSAIPETVLTSLLLRHYRQLSSGLHTLSSQSYSPAHACALFLCLSSPILTTLSTLQKCNIHILVKLSQSQEQRSAPVLEIPMEAAMPCKVKQCREVWC